MRPLPSVRPSVRLALVSSLALGFYASNPAHSSRICQSIPKPLKQLSFFPLFLLTTKQSFRCTHEKGNRYGSPFTKIKISCVGDQNSSRQANIVHIVGNTALWFKTENKYRGGTSDATTSPALIVPLFIMSVDDFLPSKTAIFGVRK